MVEEFWLDKERCAGTLLCDQTWNCHLADKKKIRLEIVIWLTKKMG